MLNQESDTYKEIKMSQEPKEIIIQFTVRLIGGQILTDNGE